MSRGVIFFAAILSVMLEVAFPQISLAAPATAISGDPTLEAIEITGNQRIEQATILSYIGIEPGDKVTRYDIDQSLKSLFATGFFADVKIMPQPANTGTVRLNVMVTENPIINQIVFEGNQRMDDDELETELDLKPRAVYTRDKVQNDTQRIQQIYRRSGRYNAVVEPKVINLSNNRVNLVYEIDEGPVTAVQRIDFVGNRIFSDEALKEVIKTTSTVWWNPFSSSEKYDPDRLAFDQELLRQFYVSQGYADFQVKSALAELAPGGDGFYITFTVDEGKKYKFGDIQVTSKLPGGEATGFDKQVITKKGATYNADEVETSIDNIVTELGDRGFAFVEVKPDFKRNTDTRTIDLNYVINRGPRVFVERIDINGNTRTLDEVVRREFRVVEGDAYSTSKLARSEQRIKNLGFFEDVKVKQQPGTRPDQTVLNVDVKEQSTGEISVGAGFSTVDGALADFGIKESNLMGTGQELRFHALVAAERQQYDIGFTEPYFLNRELAAGFDLFKTRTDFSRESSFDRESTGGALRAGYSLSEKLTHSVNYRLEQIDITDVDPLASRFIRDQEGSNITSAIGHSFTYDNRNNRFEPTEGNYFRIGQEFAGVGGDSRFIRHDIRGAQYFPLADQWTFSLAGTGGHILGVGKDVRINERFFIGQRDLRGFERAGIGPRDITTDDALGGTVFYTGTAETTFPLGLPEDLGFLGAAFVDVGSLWEPDVSGPEVVDSRSPRVAVGVGLSWKSPFGPVRIDLAHPIVKEDEDLTQLFNFSFGTRF